MMTVRIGWKNGYQILESDLPHRKYWINISSVDIIDNTVGPEGTGESLRGLG